MRPTGLLALALLVLPSAIALAQTDPYAVGDTISEITLEDQHASRGAIDASTRIILFSRDMDGGDFLKEALEDTAEGFLAGKQAVYVADISRMPSLVARMFALPSMRKRPYPMLLDRTGRDTRRFPDVEKQATVIFLEQLRIERVEHVGSADAVRGLLGLAPLSEEE